LNNFVRIHIENLLNYLTALKEKHHLIFSFFDVQNGFGKNGKCGDF
jgi:hypothetical protein